jgi:hypothetical protein
MTKALFSLFFQLIQDFLYFSFLSLYPFHVLSVCLFQAKGSKLAQALAFLAGSQLLFFDKTLALFQVLELSIKFHELDLEGFESLKVGFVSL